MKRLKLNRKHSRDQIRYRLHASIQAAAYLADDPSREDIDRELKQIMTAGRPKSPSRSALKPDHNDREDSGATKADREAQQVISGPRTEERVTAPGRAGVLTRTRFAVVTPARRTMGIGLITALPAIGIAVSPVVGSIAFAIELVVALTIIGAALFGSPALSERAFRLLRWIAYRPDPARPAASRNAKEDTPTRLR